MNKTIKKHIWCSLPVLYSIYMILVMQPARADQIDIGIFESENPGKVEVKIKPDFTIHGSQTITAIRYTIRWSDPDISISPQYIAPYFVQPVDQPEFDNDYFYQVFLAVPQDSVATAIEAGHERLVSSFTYSGSECACFELADDEWTANNSGDILLELQGEDKTGIIYEPVAHFGSVGGEVTGSTTIEQGESTGTLTLEEYSGTILGWEKKHFEDDWQQIANTAGQTTYAETPGQAGEWQYRAEVQRDDCEPAYSSPATVVVVRHTYWTGDAGSDWFDEDNWSAGMPENHVSATIPGNTPQNPEIHDGHTSCLDLVIEEGATLTIGHTASLDVVNSLDQQGSLLILSSLAHSGSLIHHSPDTQASIQFQFQGASNRRGITKNAYLMASPVHNQHIEDFFHPIEENSFSLYAWHEESKAWVDYHNGWDDLGSGSSFNTGTGYLAATADDQKLWFEGTILVENIPRENLTWTPNGEDDSQSGWHLLGNPFASAIGWDQEQWQLHHICGSAQVWDREAGSYRVVSDGMYIPPMQGFFVQVDQGNSGSLTIPADARTHLMQDKANGGDIEQIILKARDMENGSFQRNIIQHHPDATNDYDSQFDARFLEGLAPQFYALANDEQLAALTLPEWHHDLSIPLGFVSNGAQHFHIELSKKASSMDLLLEDTKTDSLHALSPDNPYVFDAMPNDEAQRFNLRFSDDGSTDIQPETPATGDLRSWLHGNKLYVENNAELVEVRIYNSSGIMVQEFSVSKGSHTYILNLPASFYIVHFMANQETIKTIKAIIP